MRSQSGFGDVPNFLQLSNKKHVPKLKSGNKKGAFRNTYRTIDSSLAQLDCNRSCTKKQPSGMAQWLQVTGIVETRTAKPKPTSISRMEIYTTHAVAFTVQMIIVWVTEQDILRSGQLILC